MHARSCHPFHTVKGIPVGEMLRSRRNCSSTTDFYKELGEIRNRLEVRKYPNWVLDRAENISKDRSRNVLLDGKGRKQIGFKTSAPITFVTNYSSQYNAVKRIIEKNLPILASDPSLRTVSQNGYRCVSRKASTLGQILAPSMISSQSPRDSCWLRHKGYFKCGATRCTCCDFSNVSPTFQSFITKENFPIKQYINCHSNWIVYLISCNICKMQYVGCTKQKLKERFRRHISDIPSAGTKIVSAVSKHCYMQHQGSSASLQIQGIERVNPPIRGGDTRKKLMNRESYWIFILGTRVPAGLNSRHDVILCY